MGQKRGPEVSPPPLTALGRYSPQNAPESSPCLHSEGKGGSLQRVLRKWQDLYIMTFEGTQHLGNSTPQGLTFGTNQLPALLELGIDRTVPWNAGASGEVCVGHWSQGSSLLQMRPFSGVAEDHSPTRKGAHGPCDMTPLPQGQWRRPVNPTSWISMVA